jgi:hypothetical protein
LFKITVILVTTALSVLLLKSNALRELTPLLREPSKSLTVKSALLVNPVTAWDSQLFLQLLVALVITALREPKSAPKFNALRVIGVPLMLATSFTVKLVPTNLWLVNPLVKIAL